MPAPDPRRGKHALAQYACHACHTIPGVTGSKVHIGPPLAGIASRTLIAGKLPNTPDNMVRWIRTPQLFDPRTAMPAMGVTERDARDIAAYLRKLD
jgi:cytochrome c2